MTKTEPVWLATRRKNALERFEACELPRWKGTTGWEFTDLQEFSFENFEECDSELDMALEAARGASPMVVFGADDVDTVVHVDDHVVAPDAARSSSADAVGRSNGDAAKRPTCDATGVLSNGVVLESLASAAETHPELVKQHLGRIVAADGSDIFTTANEALWRDGLFIYVPRGTKLHRPIVLNALPSRSGTAFHRRVLVVLDEGAEAEVWEQSLSANEPGETLHNTVIELVVGENAHLTYLSLQELNEEAWVFGNHRAEVARNGSLEWATLAFGSGNGRVRMETLLAGEGSEAKVTGAYAPHARQHIDFDTTQEHAAANTRSDLAFRGILAQRASTVWRGMIKVDPGAQGTDAFQECRNLLLSKRAHADAIPGLEILANDVRCTHAAAIAQVDREQLFYLMSRGLPQETATSLVVEGFMSEIVERFKEGPIREHLRQAIEDRLALLTD